MSCCRERRGSSSRDFDFQDLPYSLQYPDATPAWYSTRNGPQVVSRGNRLSDGSHRRQVEANISCSFMVLATCSGKLPSNSRFRIILSDMAVPVLLVVGSLGSSLSDPRTLLAGASGGVYALIAAHLATVILVRASFNLIRRDL